MIARLEGRLAESLIDGAIVDVAGVGYRIFMPVPVVVALPGAGETVRVHTHLHVREDAMTLYGFDSSEQRDLFEILLGVGGIGPKGALAALSVHTPDAFRKALATEDLDALTMIPGVGRKTAARMILELREKLALPDAQGVPGTDPATRAKLAEVKGALINLGYSSGEVRGALERVSAHEDENVEGLLKRALKELAS